jgi:prepilin-type N-terminal cleavage/methylation domain-containing protein
MSFANIKSLRQERGFTIVELLIVVVVIGILAAISVVSYTGITQQANTAKAQSNASSVKRVAEVYFAKNGQYPSAVGDFTDSSLEATLPGDINFLSGSTALSASNGTNSVIYEIGDDNDRSKASVWYWDFSASPAAAVEVEISAGGAGSNPTRVPSA